MYTVNKIKNEEIEFIELDNGFKLLKISLDTSLNSEFK